MLQTMRHLAHAWLFKALMAILVVSFGIWGIGDIFRGNPLQRVVAKAGNRSITVQELSHEFDSRLTQVRRTMNPEMTAQQAKDFGLVDMTLNGLIERVELDQAANKLGIDVSQRAIMNLLASTPEFRDKDGKFNKDLVRNMLDRANTNERDFLNQERSESTRHLLVDAFSNKNPLPKVIVNYLTQARGEKRILDVITIKNETIKNVSTPTDKDLTSYYEKNPKAFTAPEYRGITVAILSTDAVAKQINLSDDDLHSEYEARSASLDRPERRTITQVVTQDESKARQLISEARQSGNLVSAAQKMNLDAIPIDETDKKSLMAELAEPVFGLKVDEISDPIKTSLGWHVVQMKKIVPAGKPTFDSMKNEISDSMRHDQAVEQMSKLVNQLDDELAAGHSLENISEELRLSLKKIPDIDINGAAADGSEVPDFPAKGEVLKTAFSQNSGETSSIIDDKNGNFVVVRTDNVTPSSLKPFDKIQKEVVAAWKADQQENHARSEAEGVAQGLRNGKTMESLARLPGLEIRKSKPISDIGEADETLPQALMPQILKMKKGEVVTWPLAGQQLIIRVAEVDTIDPEKDDVARGRVLQDLNNLMPKELATSYAKSLRMTFPVEIHQELADGIVQTGN